METANFRSTSSRTIDSVLDEGKWSMYQQFVILLTALVIVCDGLNIQVMGFAVPAIAKEWGVPRSGFSTILAAGLIGVAFGTALGGLVGDRLGRRKALIGSVVLFGAATLSISVAHSIAAILIFRLIAGLGIGAALPNATTLCAEFTPLRWRPVAVTFAIVCIPLGGVFAGSIAAHVLVTGSWRTLFLVGGVTPLLLALVLMAILPESPRFLARFPQNAAKLRSALRRMGHNVSDEETFLETTPSASDGGGTIVNALFGSGRLVTTLSLWVAFFLCLVSVYLVFNWLPSLLAANGYGLKIASEGLAAYNFGGVFGAIVFAYWIRRQGSKLVLLIGAAGGALSALALLTLTVDSKASPSILFWTLCIHGLFVNAVQTTMYALAAHIYPTKVRATGVAYALAIGRTGAIASAFLGTYVMQAGNNAYFGSLAAGMTGVFIGLLVLKNHIPPAIERPR